MRFISDKISWTESMKEFMSEIMTKRLDRLVDSPLDFEAKISKLNDLSVKVEVSHGQFRAQSNHFDFYTAGAAAASKLQSIIVRYKKKISKKNSEPCDGICIFDSLDPDDVEVNDDLISKEKTFNLVPMSIEDALLLFDCTDYPFFVFKDIDDNDKVAVLYRRNETAFGIIRCH